MVVAVVVVVVVRGRPRSGSEALAVKLLQYEIWAQMAHELQTEIAKRW